MVEVLQVARLASRALRHDKSPKGTSGRGVSIVMQKSIITPVPKEQSCPWNLINCLLSLQVFAQIETL